MPAGTGSVELVVNPLPERTIDNSLYSEGSDGIRVLSTRFRTRPIKENTREEVRKLEDRAKTLRETIEKLTADMEASKENRALLGKLDVDRAFPGHGPLIENGSDVIRLRRKRALQRYDEVAGLVRAEPRHAWALSNAIYPPGVGDTSLGLSQSVGYLEALQAELPPAPYPASRCGSSSWASTRPPGC